ncbi:MFS transporter [Kineococcus rubinsiae]|uniref:MFS transporter n=1 Tax=Kineococcus rubinsiae TaxID=2609562 RepID=UPI001431C5E6|nr:MFS transporter [Kineococcus rubinsiae]NIZ92871.1 DHA2 family efflux MFS transporter permease subunit [Kineococcus rubinsiae]
MQTPAPVAVAGDGGSADATDTGSHRAKWIVLAVLCLAQLMVVLDATIVNIALPTAQQDLAFSDEDRQWVVTSYALAFGSLLLLGGRLSDLLGRKLMFLVGLVGFAASSALGGAAEGFGTLIVARALQGAFGAMLAPAALSLLTTTFTDPRMRTKAFSIFGAVAGAGGGIGLLLGGLLTEHLSWRWCLYINVALAVVAVAAGVVLLTNDRSKERPVLDWWGTVTAILGLVGVVYGLANAESDGWSSPSTWGFLVAGLVVLVVFTVLQSRVAHPLLPLRIVLHRNRGGSLVALAVTGAGMFGVFLFLTYYMSNSLGYSPVQTGLAFLPMIGAISVAAALLGGPLLARVGPKPVISAGMLLAAVGMVLLTGIELDSAYASAILPGLIVQGLGLGLVFSAAMATATQGVRADDAGVASAMANTTQQIGGSIGTALLSAFAGTAASDWIAENVAGAPSPEQLAEATLASYHTAFWISAGIFAGGAVASFLLLRRGVPDEAGADAPGEGAHVASVAVPAEAPTAANPTAATPRGAHRAQQPVPAAPDSAAQETAAQETAAEVPAARVPAQGVRSDVGLTVSGSVRQHGGRALPGAVVTLTDKTGRQVTRTTSGPDGSYALALPTGGTYLLIVAAAHVQPSATLVAVGGTSVRRDVLLSGRASIAGRVESRDAASGALTPVAGALVTLTDVTGEVVGSTRTDAAGGYAFAQLLGGSFVLTAQSDAHRPLARGVEIPDSGGLACDLQLTGGGRLAGTVVAASDGRRVREASVTLVDAQGEVVAAAVTDDEGAYSFDDLPGGQYTLTAAGYAPVATSVDVEEDAVAAAQVELGR